MKGYKGMKSDMTCRGMPYEVGKSYHVDGEISVCSNGLHFCQDLMDVFSFYERDGNRFFEVDASGTIETKGRKSAASDLLIERELTNIEINRTIYGYGYGDSHGHGHGNGYGDGYGGNGHGNGYGDGYGYSLGHGNGDGYGHGNGNGYGNGCSYCYGYSDGSGYGNGYRYSNGHSDGNIQKVVLFV